MNRAAPRPAAQRRRRQLGSGSRARSHQRLSSAREAIAAGRSSTGADTSRQRQRAAHQLHARSAIPSAATIATITRTPEDVRLRAQRFGRPVSTSPQAASLAGQCIAACRPPRPCYCALRSVARRRPLRRPVASRELGERDADRDLRHWATTSPIFDLASGAPSPQRPRLAITRSPAAACRLAAAPRCAPRAPGAARPAATSPARAGPSRVEPGRPTGRSRARRARRERQPAPMRTRRSTHGLESRATRYTSSPTERHHGPTAPTR